MSVKLDNVLVALRSIKDPMTQKDITQGGSVKDLKIEGSKVSLKVTVTRASHAIETEIKDALKKVAGAETVELKLDSRNLPHAQSGVEGNQIPGVKNVIAVSSGKGGVGKSTVSSNLAAALVKIGYKVGLLDTDVYGPNIPTMLGVRQPPMARQDEARGEILIPLEAHGLQLMSMGFLVKGDQPMVWRGPMLHSVVSQFLFKVDWQELDYLIVDMPPGTGDVQLSLTQLVSLSGAVLVTTPQEVSQQDVRKAILMFEKVNVPILGIVENMSYFVCDQCEKRHTIFGEGGGQALAEKYRTHLLSQIPLASAVRESGDHGTPIVLHDPNSIQAKEFMSLARKVTELVSASAKIEVDQF